MRYSAMLRGLIPPRPCFSLRKAAGTNLSITLSAGIFACRSLCRRLFRKSLSSLSGTEKHIRSDLTAVLLDFAVQIQPYIRKRTDKGVGGSDMGGFFRLPLAGKIKNGIPAGLKVVSKIPYTLHYTNSPERGNAHFAIFIFCRTRSFSERFSIPFACRQFNTSAGRRNR